MTEYKQPQDEIPGITSFLYEANRFREPHEFLNHWKWEHKSTERLKHYGFAQDAQAEDLLDRIQKLEHDLQQADMTPELRRLNSNIEQIKKELDGTRVELKNTNDNLSNTKLNYKEKEELLAREKASSSTLRIELVKYGGHHSDCNIVDALESGRMLDRTEKEACTCGWVDTKLQALQVKQI